MMILALCRVIRVPPDLTQTHQIIMRRTTMIDDDDDDYDDDDDDFYAATKQC